jgi:CRISPR-associated protein (TIGR03986 family)
MLRHEAFQNHWKRVKDLEPAPGKGSRSFYTGMDKKIASGFISEQALEDECKREYERSLPELSRLEVGNVIFAFADPTASNSILCFGKNVNFLWPASRAPRELVGDFWPSVVSKHDLPLLADADPAEATFGFAARHRTDSDGQLLSHPFRGRVSFETFWSQIETQPDAVAIQPLLSPSGVKLKARPVYLPARSDTDPHASTYDEALRLRGRKLYWHQGRDLQNVPGSHRGDAQNREHPYIRPLPAGTAFTGRIHFDNLTRSELGALLVSLCPDLYWGKDGGYGWKIGKGKPRSLGSVYVSKSELKLALRHSVSTAYRELGARVLNDEDESVSDFIDAFRRAVPGTSGRVQDLEKLLRFPTTPKIRNYIGPQPPNPPYGWMPGFNNPAGDPESQRSDGSWDNKQRPAAMKRARNITVA